VSLFQSHQKAFYFNEMTFCRRVRHASMQMTNAQVLAKLSAARYQVLVRVGYSSRRNGSPQ